MVWKTRDDGRVFNTKEEGSKDDNDNPFKDAKFYSSDNKYSKQEGKEQEDFVKEKSDRIHEQDNKDEIEKIKREQEQAEKKQKEHDEKERMIKNAVNMINSVIDNNDSAQQKLDDLMEMKRAYGEYLTSEEREDLNFEIDDLRDKVREGKRDTSSEKSARHEQERKENLRDRMAQRREKISNAKEEIKLGREGLRESGISKSPTLIKSETTHKDKIDKGNAILLQLLLAKEK